MMIHRRVMLLRGLRHESAAAEAVSGSPTCREKATTDKYDHDAGTREMALHANDCLQQ